jgi:uncharacterized protein YjbJ (UPF0337 family)
MNWSQLQFNWRGMTSLVKTHWPKLSEDEVMRIDGNRNALAAALRRLYGYREEEAEKAVAMFEKEVRFPGAVK